MAQSTIDEIQEEMIYTQMQKLQKSGQVDILCAFKYKEFRLHLGASKVVLCPFIDLMLQFVLEDDVIGKYIKSFQLN